MSPPPDLAPSSAAAPVSLRAVEEAAALDEEAAILAGKLVVSRVLAGLSAAVLVTSVVAWFAFVALVFLSTTGGGVEKLSGAVAALAGSAIAQAAVVAPCVWLRRRHARLLARAREIGELRG